MHDIFDHPDQYYLVRFALSPDGYMKPLGLSSLMNCVSGKHPDHPFVGPKASKYGVRRTQGATHWGIVYAPSDDEATLLHYGSLDAVTNKKRIIPFNYNTPYYIVVRGSHHYFKIFISREQSVPRTHTSQKDAS